MQQSSPKAHGNRVRFGGERGRERGKEGEERRTSRGPNLAVEVVGQEDVPSGKVSVHKRLPGQVAHARCNILCEFDEENRQSFWELSLAVAADCHVMCVMSQI